jgi:hypothetical protein
MRDTASRGIRRRSFLVDFRQCRLKEAIALELGNELLVRNGGLLPALCYDGQIFEVFQQLFVLSDWNNDSRTFAAIVGNVLNRIAHERKIRGKRADLQWQPLTESPLHTQCANQHARRVR